MPDVILAMTSGGKGCVGVTHDERLVGIVTDGDLRRAMGDDIMAKNAGAIMTADPFVLSPDMRMKDAIASFSHWPRLQESAWSAAPRKSRRIWA